ncbi:sigma-70 family RNA polymerase sigma factor [Bradyrhizobium sp. dw_411]|uniref:sigma-70 family RNA polymerase sigma factor n=1 Tax=Bradyrhizobium sp. dw_411 TaxID=2720082 RepID=UPI001BD16D0E|nr:sigma-70 family RNA polymerase sigma factor [Bradyrhizobium sp. dw_411]
MSSFFARTGRPSGSLQKSIIVGKSSPQDDNHARFSRLVLPHLGEAYALAYRITGSRDDAEDALQEASLRAFRAVGNVEDGSARVWVMAITRNTAYTWIRKNRPAIVFTVDNLEEVEIAQADPGEPDSETIVMAISDMETAVAALPVRFRETIILRDVHGLSYREISERTKVPIGTVMSRLARTRNRFSKNLAKSEARQARCRQ